VAIIRMNQVAVLQITTPMTTAIRILSRPISAGLVIQTRSIIVALAMPPPSHIVCNP
jgi:hypothetical protein